MSRILHSKQGVIRGDDADKWLAENDPWYGARDKAKRRGAVRYRAPLGDDWEAELHDVVEPGYYEDVVYFVQAESGGPVKIGRSMGHRLASRLAALQTAHPERLRITRLIAGDAHIEREIHSKLSHLRLRPDGEWFRCDENLARVAHAAI